MKNESKYTIIHGDSSDELDNIRSGSQQLILTSPPYNVGKEYEDKQPMKNYVDWLESFITNFYRILSDSGSIAFQVGNYIDKKTKAVYPIDCLVFNAFINAGFIPRNRIIWSFGHGLHCKYRFSGRHETILWFTKSKDFVFNLDPVRVPQKYPGKKHYKGENKGKLSGNPLGKNPSDVWEISNVKNNHPEKTTHPCQFPEELVRRLILSLTNELDSVLDPFAGSGTVASVCKQHQRQSVSIENKIEYIPLIKSRIN